MRVIFAGLAIFISCLGLFGLTAYVAEQRTREIGIRKVLGASVSQVWLLLFKDFMRSGISQPSISDEYIYQGRCDKFLHVLAFPCDCYKIVDTGLHAISR